MKRFVLIGMAIMLLVFVYSCRMHSGSMVDSTDSPVNTSQVPLDTADPIDSSIQWNDDPPQKIIFCGLEAYHKFSESTELDESEFNEFIITNSYDMNGVETKQDVERVLEMIGSMPIPAIDGFVLEWLSVALDGDTVYFLYENKDTEKDRLGFEMTVFESSEDAENIANRLNYETLILPLGTDTEVSFLVRAIDNKDESGENSYYFTNVRSHWVRLITTMSEEQLLNVLQSCRITTINKYEE